MWAFRMLCDARHPFECISTNKSGVHWACARAFLWFRRVSLRWERIFHALTRIMVRSHNGSIEFHTILSVGCVLENFPLDLMRRFTAKVVESLSLAAYGCTKSNGTNDATRTTTLPRMEIHLSTFESPDKHTGNLWKFENDSVRSVARSPHRAPLVRCA